MVAQRVPQDRLLNHDDLSHVRQYGIDVIGAEALSALCDLLFRRDRGPVAKFPSPAGRPADRVDVGERGL